MTKYYHPDTDFMRKYDLPPPTTFVHGTEEDIRAKLTPLKATNWRMEGAGHLVADTEMGPLHQQIDPSYICKGTDNNGMPILVKIGE